jgi:hypothetical protein
LHAAVQTVDFKPKAKVYEEIGIQTQEVELKSMKLSRTKVIDRSYLLEDYREKDRRFKMYSPCHSASAALLSRRRLSITSNPCGRYTTTTIIRKPSNCLTIS